MILPVCLMCTLNPSKAVEVDDLYQAKIKLASQSRKDLSAAQRSAFKQVLVKIAGSAAIEDNAQLKAAIRKPNNYLNQFSYSQNKGQLFLLASFEQDKINKLLQQAQVGIWGKHRPLTTIWLIREYDEQRSLIGDLADNEIKDTIYTQAFNRGLPINFPLYDLTDLMSVSETDVWGRFSQTLIAGSERYMAESVVSLRISYNTLVDSSMCQSNCDEVKPLVVDWSLWFRDKQYVGNYQGTDEPAMLAKAINEISDKLFENNSFVLAQDNQGFLDLELIDIQSMQQFVDINTFFNDLSLVSDVRLLRIAGNKMLFRLNISASKDAVKQALKLERKIEALDEFFTQTDDTQPVTYRWKG